MKKVSIVSLIVLLFVLAGCQKERSEDPPKDNKASILGKWQLDKYIDDNYQPIDVLEYHDEETGDPGDYVIFKNDNTYDVYENGEHTETLDYKFLNDSTIDLDEEPFVIRKLTDTELYLHQETADPNGYWKEIIRIYLVR